MNGARAIGWGKVTRVTPHDGYSKVSVEADEAKAPVGIRGNAILAVGDDVEYLPEIGDDVCIAVPDDALDPIQLHRSEGEWSRPEPEAE